MALTIKQSVAKGTAEVTKKKNGETIAYQSAEVDVGETAHVGEMCHVSMQLGTTINTGNYESVQVKVSLMVPSTLDEIDAKMDFTRKWVLDTLESVVEDLDLKK